MGPNYYEFMTYMLPPFLNHLYCLLRMIPYEKIVPYPKQATPLIYTFPRKFSTICSITARTIPNEECPSYSNLCGMFWCKHTIAYLQHHPRMDEKIQKAPIFGFYVTNPIVLTPHLTTNCNKKLVQSIRCFRITFSCLECKSLYLKWSNIEYRKQPKMAGQFTCSNPTQGGTPPQ